MSNTLVDVIQKITEKGWRVTFEGFSGREGNLFFTITTKGVPYSHVSGAVSKYDLAYAKMGAVDALAYRLEKAFEKLQKFEKDPYGDRITETEATTIEPLYRSYEPDGFPRSGD